MNEQEQIRGCILGLTPQMLSDWHDQAMISSTAETLRQHIPTCAACQQYLAAYSAIDAAVRRFEPSAALAAFAEIVLHDAVAASDMRERQNAMNHHHLHTKDIEEHRSQPTRMASHLAPTRKRRARGSLVGLGAVAAMLLVALVAVALFRYPFLFGGTKSALYDSHQVMLYPLYSGSRDVTTLDPALVQDASSSIPISLVFPGLLTQDENGNPIPWAAAALPTFNTSNNAYIFTIKPGLHWSDGEPIDANTFAYSLNRVLNPCTKTPGGTAENYYLFPIKDAVAFANEKCAADGKTVEGPIATLNNLSIYEPDSSTLVIELAAPAPYFLDALTTAVASAQPQQLIDQYGSTWANHLADGSGFGGNIFRVLLWDHTGHLTLVRNAQFWGTPSVLSRVDFTIYQIGSGFDNGTAAEYSDYLHGKLEVGMPPLEQYQQARQRHDFHEQPLLAITYLQPNWAQAPFDDVRVRQALALSINKETLASTIYHNAVIPTNHIVPDGMPGYDAALTAPDGMLNLTGNIPQAQNLMQQYAVDKCGGKLSKCPAITFSANGTDPSSATGKMDQAVVQMWKQAFPGYPITLDFSLSHYATQYVSITPQMFANSWIADYPDPQGWLSLQFLPGALGNSSNVNVPAATTLMTAADQDLNPTERVDMYNQAEQLLVLSGAWIPLFQQKLYYNVPDNLKKFAFTPSGTLTFSTWQQMWIASTDFNYDSIPLGAR